MGKIVTYGELMLRLSPPGYKRFLQTDSFNVTFGGGEANVAVSLSVFGHEAYFVSCFPPHEMGEAAVQSLQRYGVQTDYIIREGDRIGVYFLETGASQRPSKVIYDRAGSAVSELDPGKLNWDRIFDGKDWFHWTGITPALGKKPAAALLKACQKAKGHGVKVSCDLNFRSKLWTEEEARKVMRPLMEYVDVCIANEEDADRSLGVVPEKSDVEKGELHEEGYKNLAIKLKKEFGFESVAITLRESFSASHNGWSAILHDEVSCLDPVRSTRYEIDIVDRVGGGDSFAGGLIHGLLTYNDTQRALEFAAAASCLKQTLPGDFNLVSQNEVEKLMESGGSGRVER
jgi:2-dehydro-3-deoxygluconokinase